jgi:hypothetical protein
MFSHTSKDVFVYPELKATVLDRRLIEGSGVVSLTHWPPFTHRKISGAHFD